jgi:hypothetical protein
MFSAPPTTSRVSFDLSNTLFIASLVCMCLTEAFLIRGLWLRPLASAQAHRRFDLPFLVWIPAFGEFLFLQDLRRKVKDRHLTPALASKLSSGLATLLLLAYLLITRVTIIAFR